MIQIICTLLMIAVVILGVVKKYHPVTVFFSVSLISLLIWSAVTGQSTMGENGTGNVFLDVFEYTYSIIKTQISGNVLICASVFGYVGFMNKIGASQAFTVVLSKPLSKIKQPYILLGLIIIITACLKLVVPSAISLVALLFAILFPIFSHLGCSGPTIASAFVLGTCITWGPADAGVALTASLADPSLSVSDFFVSYQLVACLCEMVVMAIVFVFLSIYYDKKHNLGGVTLSEEQKKKQQENLKVSVPTYYCIMPLFPLILILLFSGKILPITLSTVAVVVISICISDIIHVLTNRKTFRESVGDVNADLLEFGGFMGRIGFLIVGGSLFAGAISMVGGMTLLVTALNDMGGNTAILAALGVLVGIIVVACTGSYTANLNFMVPFMVTVANVTGANPAALAQLANMACGLGSGLTPVSGTMLFLTAECKTDFPVVLKRNILPLLAAAITGYIVIFVTHLA